MLRTVAATLLAVILVAACSSASTPTPSPIGGSPGASSGANPSTGFDPWAITRTAILSCWQSSPAEGDALTQALFGYQSAFPNVKVDYQPLGGDFPAGMAAKFASGDVPDVSTSMPATPNSGSTRSSGRRWTVTSQKSASFETTQFFDGYASIFKGADGKTYGLPKDGKTIAMAYNTALVPTPPKTMDELVTLAELLKGKDGLKAPLCLSQGPGPWARLPVRTGWLAAVR